MLARIAEILGAPVIDQGDRANLPPGHPLHVTGDAAPLQDADTVLLLDSEVPWVPAQLAPPATARVVQIDADPVKPSMPLWSYPVEIALTADTRVALLLLEQTLLRLANDELREKWSTCRGAVESCGATPPGRWRAGPSPTATPMPPTRCWPRSAARCPTTLSSSRRP